MKERVPVSIIAFPAKTVYVLAFFAGVALAAAYSFGKKVADLQAREKNTAYNETPN